MINVTYFLAGSVKKKPLVMNITILQTDQEELSLYAAMDLQ
jgi:hypothetical protein